MLELLVQIIKSFTLKYKRDKDREKKETIKRDKEVKNWRFRNHR